MINKLYSKMKTYKAIIIADGIPIIFELIKFLKGISLINKLIIY